MRLPLGRMCQPAQINSISIGSVVVQSDIYTLFLPHRYVSLDQNRACSRKTHGQDVGQKSLHGHPPVTRIPGTRFFFLTPEHTSPAARARISFPYTFPHARTDVLIRANRKFSFLAWVPGTPSPGVSLFACGTEKLAIVASQISTRRDPLLVLRQQTRAELTLFTFSLHAPYSGAWIRKTAISFVFNPDVSMVQQYLISQLTSSLPGQMKVISPLSPSTVVPASSRLMRKRRRRTSRL